MLDTSVSKVLEVVNRPAEPRDVEEANAIRNEYYFEGAPNPYMVDITRGFRLAKGAKVYIEVGTQDKGNIAWLARTKLAPGATVIDIDFNIYPHHDKKIADEMVTGGFDYHALRGDCLSSKIVGEVRRILNDRKADLIFCDSHYTYDHTIKEFGLYFPFVKDGGFLFFHDAQWSGDPNGEWPEFRKRGKGYAVADLDKTHPAYAVFGPDTPVYRFKMPEQVPSYWGTLAIFPKTASPTLLSKWFGRR